MKSVATYCLLLAWCSYFMLSQVSPGIAARPADKHATCEVEGIHEIQKDNCCDKFHKEQNDKKDCGNQKEDKDCCGQTDCSRTCCHIGVVVIPVAAHVPSLHMVNISSFSGMNHLLLPAPFIGVASPPPNA